MLKPWQLAALVLLGIALWALVTWRMHAHPEYALDEARQIRGYLTAPVGGAISVWLCKLVGRLRPDQLLPGVSVVGAVAMMADGAALMWFPQDYAAEEKVMRIEAAGLLWGYGVAFAVAVAWTEFARRRLTMA